jgi:hypothetical protein
LSSTVGSKGMCFLRFLGDERPDDVAEFWLGITIAITITAITTHNINNSITATFTAHQVLNSRIRIVVKGSVTATQHSKMTQAPAEH